MRAKYLNPMIGSLVEVVESLSGIKLEKSDLSKKEKFETEKEYIIPIDIKGDLNGYFVISMDKEMALLIIKSMTAGMGVDPTDIDEMGESCLIESAGITSSKIKKQLGELEINCDVVCGTLSKKEDLNFEEKLTLGYSLKKDENEIELNISVF